MGQDDGQGRPHEDVAAAVRPPTSLLRNRWLQLTAGVIGMIAVSNFQYGWTFFVDPLRAKYGWERSDIQRWFTLFVLLETWLVPIEAYLVDRVGPFFVMVAGALLSGLGWVVNAHADSLGMLYLGAAISGTGVGMVYGTSIGAALKWFPDRRGLAAGLTAAGFGAGSALTVRPIQLTIEHFGYEKAFLWFGIGQGLVALLVALVLRFPRHGETPVVLKPHIRQSDRDATPFEMLRTPVFWLVFVMMTMVTMGGLMMQAQIAPMARDLGVADVPLYLFFATWPALTVAGTLERIMSGVTRPFFGWVSDYIGRERTMFIAFGLEGLAILLFLQFAHVPLLFALLVGLTFFAWGEIFSLFPALIADMYGRKFATTNYALLYTAKGMAALTVPLGNIVAEHTGSWSYVFGLAVVLDWITALLALFVLQRLRHRSAPC